jgi:hypothetical protein
VSSSNAIAPIPTRYAGCHFRSRLEARWAVFFDTLGVRWEYEPQGFEIGWYERRWMYLPDFYLTDLGVWVEVKGSETQIDYDMILAAVVPHQGLPLDPSGTPVPDPSRARDRLLILGPVPKPPTCRHWHSSLQFWKGDVFQDYIGFLDNKRFFPSSPNPTYGCDVDHNFKFGDDCNGVTPENVFFPLTQTMTAPFADPRHRDHLWHVPSPQVIRAYTAALSARFEHGQSGA